MRSWLITGCSRGLGRALAETILAETADRVAVTARDPEKVQDLVELYPERAFPFRLDVTEPEQVHAAVNAAIGSLGKLDIVVNNAGWAEISSFEETPQQSFRDQLEVNFFGAVEVCRAVVPHFRARRAGHIVQISAISGRFGVAGLSADTAAKFAIEGFSETLGLELAPLGIAVTLIEPGGIRTGWGGASMHIGPIGPDYDETVGRLARLIQANLGQEPSDPTLCARAVITAVDAAEPPLRLVLGRDALQAVTASDRTRAEADQQWRAVTVSVDNPGPA